MDLTDLNALILGPLNGYSYCFYGVAHKSNQKDGELISGLKLTCLAYYEGDIYQQKSDWRGEVILSIYKDEHEKKLLF